MIKIIKENLYVEASTQVVNGHELMLFYCAWQYKLWPTWFDHKLCSTDTAFIQHKNILNSISDKKTITLSTHGKVFIDAYEYAVQFVRSLNITVEEYEYKTVQVLTLINK